MPWFWMRKLSKSVKHPSRQRILLFLEYLCMFTNKTIKDQGFKNMYATTFNYPVDENIIIPL